ncbi:LamG-like jellyroll fold domain-containing protein [Streptomyces sp. A012304]|uniref:LamG-like jellyroll fold domain-containing protein n=1 Tax=Streptomyces sp. A012304 TaxID=375446 RepID=UPI0022316229|nr:LamG-like jellyroll fold domain-containing protein [Streptomyces sp. A012304]GKQ37937.1 hypothetical protein ALMP_44720 [Streptomyces sp. A012304]
MSADFLDIMRGGLTPAYDRGMERLEVGLEPAEGNTLRCVHDVDFEAYRARYGRLPDSPRYLLAPRGRITEPCTVEARFIRGPGREEEHAPVHFPAGWPAGRTKAVEFPGPGATLTGRTRLTGLAPLAHAPQSPTDWEVTALLGNLAKLLWVIGWDYEDLSGQIADVSAQRYAVGRAGGETVRRRHSARGFSLDLIGQDLGAPRFPPRPYTWDDLTVALYHLDDRAAPGSEVVDVADAAAGFGATPHGAKNAGASSGRIGRFSAAFEFTGTSTVTVRHDPVFDVGPQTPLTVEAVIRASRGAPRPGAVMSKRSLLNSASSPGWSLTVGPYREVERNLRFSIADQAGTAVEVFADRDVGDGLFHHVAGVVERLPADPGEPAGPRPAVVRLHIDGVEVARRQVDRLGALSSPEGIALGLGREQTPTGTAVDAGFVGLMEEVRISRTARTAFEPVTGESDDHYRMRLALFQGWLVPTPDALRTALNRPGPDGEPQAPIEIVEGTERPATGSVPLRVLPGPLVQGQSITADGDQRAGQADAVGTPEDEPDFDPGWLSPHDGGPGLSEASAGTQMQLGVKQALDALLARLPHGSGEELHILKAYDLAATDVHRVGRALLLRHSTLGSDELAVHAHAVGFGWVHHTTEGAVQVAQPPGPAFHIAIDRVRVGEPPVALTLEPSPDRLAGAEVRWSVVRCGPGAATVRQGPPALLTAEAPGEVTLQVEVVRAGHVQGGSRVVRISPAAPGLAVGESISGSGRRGVSETEAAGERTEDFDPDDLLVRTDDLLGEHPLVAYGDAPADRRMQRATSHCLDRLLDLMPTDGTLSVLGSFDPAATGLRGQGRALVLRHSALDAGELAVAAFDAGFAFVEVATAPGAGPVVHVAVPPGEPIEVHGPAELAVDQQVTVTADPHAEAVDACFSQDGGHLHLSDAGSHRVTTFTVAADPPGGFPTLTFARSAPVTPFPGPLTLAGGRLYVAHELPGRVSVLDPATLAPAAPAITGPRPVALTTDGNRLFVAYAGDRTLRAYDPLTQRETGTLTLPGVPRALDTGTGAAALAVLLDEGRFCLVTRSTLRLQGSVIGTGPGTEARDAALTPDGTGLYVGCLTQGPDGSTTASVQVFATGTGQQTADVRGFPDRTVPVALRAAPDGRHVYVATAGSPSAAGRVHVIDTTTDTLLPDTFTPGGDCLVLAPSPAAAPYGPCLLAAPRGSATVLLADTLPLRESPPGPPRLRSRQLLGPGAVRELVWSTTPTAQGRAELDTLGHPVNRIRGRTPGLVLTRASYFSAGGLRPYQCEVRLAGDLDARPDFFISKDRYDLVLNVLNWFHPIGVEFRTERLRAHVRELAGREADTDVLPAYTFPTYHRWEVLPFRPPDRPLRPDKDEEP